MPVSDADLLATLHEAATAVHRVLAKLGDWGLVPGSRHQYRHDLVADAAAVGVLRAAGLGVVSEESGDHGVDAGIVVVLDPVDGSTNASHGLPWWNTSLCAVDAHGPRAAVVVDQPGGRRFEAVRGGGARLDGQTIGPTACRVLGDAVIGLNGYPGRHFGWKQYRALGATALDLCAVAAGMLDGFVDCSARTSAPWDYLAGMLVCVEAGAAIADAGGEELTVWGHADRRTPVAAATPELLAELLAARNAIR